MIKSIIVPALSVALEKLKDIVSSNESLGKRTVIFCEDRLTLATERAVCSAVGGTFSVSVYTLARFLSSEKGKRTNVLSSQGSAMVIRRIIEENKSSLKLFGKFSAAASASAVYDTIALLYSSKIKAEDLSGANAEGLLESKLSDISLIYSLYDEYLKANGKIDRNAYLSELPAVICESKRIAGNEVIFFGFQSFTRSSSECVRAAFQTAENVTGIFTGGREEIYTNEGPAVFEGIAEGFGGAKYERAAGTLIREAELLRRSLFNPESYFNKNIYITDKVRLYEAADEEEEIEFVAASIKKYVLDGVTDGESGVKKNIRYGDISVMVPDMASAEHRIERIFSQYRIPYYADRRHPLSEHPISDFILSYLACALTGCAPKDTDAVISSPLFPVERDARDGYRNYALRLADYRGAIKREPKREILSDKKFNFEAVQRVRKVFLRGLELLPVKLKQIEGEEEKKRVLSVSPPEITAGIKALLEEFKTEEKLQLLKENFKDSYPTASEFSGRVYESAISVIEEAENILGGGYLPLNEYIKILKSGFIAAEISLIPPKADAVFVGDIASTANTGSKILFALSLTDGVPRTSSDTSLLTDSEIAVLERVNLDISPKIRQVNMRRREQTSLNICAFSDRLYLIHPARQGGEDCGTSEIISYAQRVFGERGEDGQTVNKRVMSIWRERRRSMMPYYCSEKLPALKSLYSTLKKDPKTSATVYTVLNEEGFKSEADGALISAAVDSISRGRELFIKYDKISPSVLESYHSCPYKNFMSNGLGLQEREEGTVRALDVGNFIHKVLQNLSLGFNEFADREEARARAHEEAEKLLKHKSYSSLTDTKAGQYTADELIREAGEVAAGAFEQLANSTFTVKNPEMKFDIELSDGVRLNGKIDRVDKSENEGSDDFVRIIDYKTGAIDSSIRNYYMGLKLQLPIYLNAASEGGRAVGAYYFPAAVSYSSEPNGVFRLAGFMDGSREVVAASDTTLSGKGKSNYVDAAYSYIGSRPGGVMDSDIFRDFIEYSTLIARQAVEEMKEGNITPSPAGGACEYCQMKGSCTFSPDVDGDGRGVRAVKSGDLAKIVRTARGETEGEDEGGEDE